MAHAPLLIVKLLLLFWFKTQDVFPAPSYACFYLVMKNSTVLSPMLYFIIFITVGFHLKFVHCNQWNSSKRCAFHAQTHTILQLAFTINEQICSDHNILINRACWSKTISSPSIFKTLWSQSHYLHRCGRLVHARNGKCLNRQNLTFTIIVDI